MTEQLEKKINALAEEITSLSAAKLLLDMRFFARAINRLPQTIGQADYCDGKCRVYKPLRVIERYKLNALLPERDYLHSLIHCIFRHFKIGTTVDRAVWSAACDIAAEAVILPFSELFEADPLSKQRYDVIKQISSQIRPITAEKIYSYLISSRTAAETIDEYAQIFHTDEHIFPFENNRVPEPEQQLPTIGISADNDKNKNKEQGNEQTPSEEDGSDGGNDCGDEQTNEDQTQEFGKAQQLNEWELQRAIDEMNMLEGLWKDISKEIAAELEAFGKKYGDRTDGLVEAIKEVNRDKCDYEAFLRQFAVNGEVMRSDPECFDMNYYCYSLSLYGDLPLIEPLETREKRLVRDLVIALDTSGSVRGELVRNFVRKTYSILKSEESFFTRVNICIMQCDSQIKEAVMINSDAELENYINGLEIKGLGGTDFTPVFEAVDGLRKKGVFSGLKGLIYFTDGFGKYPEDPPPYKTAFVFLKEDYEQPPPDVPPWAIRIILDKEDI